MTETAPVAPTPTAAAPAPRRATRLAPLVAGLAILGIMGFFWVRGTHVTEMRDPASSAEGYVRQVVAASDGTKQVRCSVVLDVPAEKVWAVVSDYPHFADWIPHTRPFTVEREADGRHHVRGAVTSAFIDWPIDARVKHEEDPAAGRWRSSWNEPGGALTRNEGSWTITRKDAGSCLCVYVLDVQVKHGPDALVRNVLLHKMRTGLNALKRELAKRG
jgi:uncharacterized membrane protein